MGREEEEERGSEGKEEQEQEQERKGRREEERIIHPLFGVRVCLNEAWRSYSNIQKCCLKYTHTHIYTCLLYTHRYSHICTYTCKHILIYLE